MAAQLLRSDDLLNLRVEAENLRLDTEGPDAPALTPENPDAPAWLTFEFPPQSIAEGAYYEAAVLPADGDPGRPDPDQPASPPAQDQLIGPTAVPGHTLPGQKTVAQMARPSRLVFRVPNGVRLAYSTAGLLDWSKLVLSVNPIAAIGPEPTAAEIAAAPAIHRPAATESAIEMPYRLVISPGADVAWDHRTAPFFHAGQCELWHTRLFHKTDDGASEPTADAPIPLRAVWSDDYNAEDPTAPPDADPDLGRVAMSPRDRSQIVVLTSAFHGYVADYASLFDLSDIQVAGVVGAALRPVAPRLAIPNAALLLGPRFSSTRTYVPEPFFAEQLFLSPLGGWLKSRGGWDPRPRKAPRRRPPIDANIPGILKRAVRELPRRGRAVERQPAQRLDELSVAVNPAIAALLGQDEAAGKELDLSEWVHTATGGRDHYVRIVYEGELWPFRHRAALVKVTERKFLPHDNIVEARLVQRNFIVVRRPEQAFAERANPFQRVRLTTLVTPSIAEPQPVPGTEKSFWVEVMTGPSSRRKFPFHGVGRDVAADDADFTVPMMFVSATDISTPAGLAAARAAYNAAGEIAERTLNVPGQKISFAPPRAGDGAGGNTRLAARTLNFVMDAAYAPEMLMAEVNVPPIQQLLQSDAGTTIRYYQGYLDRGMEDAANKTGVFAEVAKLVAAAYTADKPFAGLAADTLGVAFSADKAGGFATPDMGVSTLTADLGPMAGDVAKAAADAFDPADFFPKGGVAKIFGTFDLADLLPAGSHSENAPKVRTDASDIPGGKMLKVTMDWSPAVKDVDLGVAAFKKDHNGVSKLEIHGVVQKPVTLDAPAAGDVTSEFTGRLNDFQVSVLRSVLINFTLFAFTAKSGQKTDVTVHLDPALPLEFDGDLKFVEELRKAIPPGLFGDGPSLDISPTGIRAGFELALPPVTVGVFALKDVSLGAALTLPFLDGKPAFDFNVSRRDHPFQVAVMIFAGGGFFHLQVDTAGIRQLEAAIEFGAAASLDIGVASGEVHMMAGIYFSLQRKEGSTDLKCTLAGYLRLGGSLSVLGLVKNSVEFNLSFVYVNDGGSGKAYGRATLTVHVEVLFFSTSVELTVEKAFGGSSGDPNFLDQYDTQARWKEYAQAFA
jgi:hypothetical protein